MPIKIISKPSSARLQQTFGIGDLVFLSLGSILGTGVFIGIGIVVGVANTTVLPAIVLSAFVALCTELNIVQLSLNPSDQPLACDAYGYQYATPWLGFTAAWAFLLAKVAAAAIAALGFAGYLLNALDLRILQETEVFWLIPVALLLLIVLTSILLCGLHHAGLSRLLILGVTLLSLFFFLGSGFPFINSAVSPALNPFFAASAAPESISDLFRASALMFVAYTGYGRIAYLNHAVQTPRRTIPQAIAISLFLSMVLYLAVAIVGVGTVGTDSWYQAVDPYLAPLEIAIRQFGAPGSAQIVAIGAVTAMLGTLLNVILDCAQLLQILGQQRDLPRAFAHFNRAGTTPTFALLAVSGAIAGLILVNDIKTLWSFSAFSILLYSVIAHFAVLQQPRSAQFYARKFTQLSLLACIFLAFWIDWHIWLVSLGLITIGLIWRGINQWVNEQIRD
jgi:basic amino acid/polyamine antiporter, APA family